MNKKAQVTIFVIIAILIIAAVGLFFVLKSSVGEKPKYPTETSQVYKFVQQCLEDSSELALYYIGMHGGYYLPSNNTLEYGVPYYFYNGEYYFPTMNKIEKETSLFIKDSLDECINNFEEFPEFQINASNITINTFVKDNSVLIKMDYPISIKKGENMARLKKFETEVPMRLELMYNLSKFILDNEYENNGELCLSCLADYQIENSLQVSMKSFEEGVVYEIIDSSSKVNLNAKGFEPEKYKFKFAVGY